MPCRRRSVSLETISSRRRGGFFTARESSLVSIVSQEPEDSRDKSLRWLGTALLPVPDSPLIHAEPLSDFALEQSEIQPSLLQMFTQRLRVLWIARREWLGAPKAQVAKRQRRDVRAATGGRAISTVTARPSSVRNISEGSRDRSWIGSRFTCLFVRSRSMRFAIGRCGPRVIRCLPT